MPPVREPDDEPPVAVRSKPGISVRSCGCTDVTTSHTHQVHPAGVERAIAGTVPRADAQSLAELLTLLADPVRLRVLFALASTEELCVGDLAMALEISMDQSSYALKQLRTAGLVQARRDGRVMHYRLADGFPHQLLDHCLRQLLTISDQENRT